jgi:hypothetical protein
MSGRVVVPRCPWIAWHFQTPTRFSAVKTSPRRKLSLNGVNARKLKWIQVIREKSKDCIHQWNPLDAIMSHCPFSKLYKLPRILPHRFKRSGRNNEHDTSGALRINLLWCSAEVVNSSLFHILFGKETVVQCSQSSKNYYPSICTIWQGNMQ